ncbi:MAG: hypothetical protein U1D98_05015, partial [Candidatus Gracilibacteria bacterium]|nr:hypothetical protein [Candidatus Gracilibacteria bacterium]
KKNAQNASVLILKRTVKETVSSAINALIVAGGGVVQKQRTKNGGIPLIVNMRQVVKRFTN